MAALAPTQAQHPFCSPPRRFYQTADPLASAVVIALLLAAVCFLLSLPTNRHSWVRWRGWMSMACALHPDAGVGKQNCCLAAKSSCINRLNCALPAHHAIGPHHAQVDKLWSVAPVYYLWHFALHDQLKVRGVPVNARLLAMATLASVWGVRLTFNFARKGGYRWRDEDYRWGRGPGRAAGRLNIGAGALGACRASMPAATSASRCGACSWFCKPTQARRLLPVCLWLRHRCPALRSRSSRWPWLRARIHWLPFLVFNLTFIAVIQVGCRRRAEPGR